MTVVCPPVDDAAVEELWTSIDCPVMEAIVPKAPGMVAGLVEGVELAAVDLVALAADDPPPQAANTRATPPRSVTTANHRPPTTEVLPGVVVELDGENGEG